VKTPFHVAEYIPHQRNRIQVIVMKAVIVGEFRDRLGAKDPIHKSTSAILVTILSERIRRKEYNFADTFNYTGKAGPA
jgi:hypothetical protein